MSDDAAAGRAGEPAERLVDRVRCLLPTGSLLPDRIWHRRHAAILRVAEFHVALVFGVGLVNGSTIGHAAFEASLVGALALAARFATGPRPIRASYATLSLISASAMLVHQAGGVTEWHFHFFVMVGLITLYQEWAPFAVAVAFVVLHHAVIGTLDPEGVFGTPAAIAAPWKWALVHGAFVLAAAVVNVAGWRLSETHSGTDPLTGLPNRLGFTELVDQRLARNGGLALMFIDLDRFKDINDTLGHGTGDEVLRTIARRTREELRGRDIVVRLGGDEFAALVADVSPDAARRVAERLVRTLNQPIDVAGSRRAVQCRASIGVALSDPGTDALELTRRADKAMYRAKHLGGDGYAVYEADTPAPIAETAARPG